MPLLLDSLLEGCIGQDHAFKSSHQLVLSIIVALVVVWPIASIIYNLFFHPLRNFPGPLHFRASFLPFVYHWVMGKQTFVTEKLHRQYGPVVRISPKHLSFCDTRAWKDIYGHLAPNRDGSKTNEMDKTTPFDRMFDEVPRTILNAGRDEHKNVRRALAHGFSESSLRQQEPTIAKSVNLLMKKLHGLCDANGGKEALNAEAWYNYTTFDITGDLIFGSTFGCLEDSTYHPWIEGIISAAKFSSMMMAMSYVGLHWLVQVLYRLIGHRSLAKMNKLSGEMIQGRLGIKEDRADLFDGLRKIPEPWKLSFESLSGNAFVLVLAGSETTSTTLSGATYLLTSHPDKLEKLAHEVRSAFKSADEINMTSASQLPYLRAVLNESLRMFPPVVSGLVREVPSEGGQIAGQYIAGGTFVEVQQWVMNHSPTYWNDPWTFQPERFLAANLDEAREAGNSLDALQPFSLGPRNCIGRNLAHAEMRLIFARIIYDFDLTLASDSQQWIERLKTFVLWDRIPLNVHFKPVAKPEATEL
ncbi:isotrichodermin C-15 hydroxylase [Podospora didyma]|uniref:Isotrichodermin C-15 hydroxylase n=1 Tax=Podospora didyma TaxID=330526 RepID=A0AAE0U785_9PEZI|nr:isotrichodermin C-15 hydroxylase [Podospora didyma]